MDNLFFTLEQLRILVTVVKEGNFKKAANKLFKAQSTITVQIQNLENSLGTQLVIRNKRNIHLTEKGLIVFKYATKILTLSNNVLTHIHNLQDRERRIVIATNQDFYNPIFLKIIDLFNKYFFSTDTIELKNDKLTNLFFDLQNGKIDFLFTSDEVPDIFLYDFNQFSFIRDEIILIKSVDYLIDNDDLLKLTDIYNYPLLFLPDESLIQQNLFKSLEKNNIFFNKFNNVIKFNSFDSLLHGIYDKQGIALLFSSMLSSDFLKKDLDIIRLKPIVQHNNVNIIFNSFNSLNLAKKKFIFLLHYIKILNF